MFIREKDEIEITKGFSEGEGLEEKTRDNALFLSVVDQFNGKTARTIMQWFSRFMTISGLSHEDYKDITFSMLSEKAIKPSMVNFYVNLGLGFDDISVRETGAVGVGMKSLVDVLKSMKGDAEVEIKTTHKRYDKENKVVDHVEFDLRNQESSGTNKLFNISGAIFDILNNGGILIVDELDASLHPLLTLAITRLFNSAEHNPNNAQLVFATHDTNLLHYSNYRRDQIYFVEKDHYGASDLYSLVEYKEENKTIRKDSSYEKDYIRGRYGAIPFIGNLFNTTK